MGNPFSESIFIVLFHTHTHIKDLIFRRYWIGKSGYLFLNPKLILYDMSLDPFLSDKLRLK